VLTDPVSLTYATVAKSLPRTGTNDASSTYQLVETGGTLYRLTAEHSDQKSGRKRCAIRLRREALVTDPLVTGQSRAESLTLSVTADWSAIHTPTDAQTLYAALLTFLTSATFLRVASGET